MLLDYVVFAALIFYMLTIRVLCFATNTAEAERPYHAFGYPVLPALYIVTATIILLVLALYHTQPHGRVCSSFWRVSRFISLWRKSKAPIPDR